MDEENLMRNISRLNREIDELCYQRDMLIEQLHGVQDRKKRRTEDQ